MGITAYKEIFRPEGWLKPSSPFSLTALKAAMENDTVLTGTVLMCNQQHDLTVQLPGIKGIIPREEGALGISEGTVRDIALISRVGKEVCFCVKEITTDCTGNTVAVLSRRRAQQLCSEKYLSHLVSGDIIDARVTHLEPFGAFCDIGCGIVSLIPIDCISVSRISHPKDRFYIGQDIRAVVTGRDEAGRITLSHKELLGTWQQNADRFMQGQTVAGKVRMVEDYGCFVELSPNLAGLAEPKKDISAGQTAAVYIKSIIPEKMKVKLIIIDTSDTQYAKPENNYFVNDDHIDYWQYSPDCCDKYIGTEF